MINKQQYHKFDSFFMKQTKKVNKFVILLKQELGAGSFAKTYKAYKDKDHSKMFACKVINKEEMKEKSQNIQYFINRVREQFKVLKQLKHENVIAFQDSQETKNNLYLFFQYCEQGTLEKYIAEHKFEHNIQEEIRIIRQIINGCSYFVEKGIIHRDIKPQNILLKNNVIKIADFGLAKNLQGSSESFSTVVGTPRYMAPQILKNYKAVQTKKCDVWSVGITIYELVTGYLPFGMSEKMNSQYQIQQKIQEQANSEWSQIKNKLFRQLIKGMLVVNPTDRITFEQAKKIMDIYQKENN